MAGFGRQTKERGDTPTTTQRKDGTAYLNLETVARGLGFTETKDGKEYVMWRRVDGYLTNLGFGTSAERPEYIPENVFYRLAMKAKTVLIGEAYKAQKMTQGGDRKSSAQNEHLKRQRTSEIIAEDFGVGSKTVERAQDFVNGLNEADIREQ